ncbi:MAG: discoidin domain-containing protein [Planctomycetaceae bacterium]|nr:discoidin domain-containing protein [Planctomycetaceae bacterium]
MSTMLQWPGRFRIPAGRLPMVASGLILTLLCCGCGDTEGDQPATAVQPVEKAETAATEPPPKPPEPAKPDPAELWQKQAAEAEAALAVEEYDEESLAAAQEQVGSLRALLEEQEMPPEGWQEQLALMESELKIRRRKLENRRRDELLAEAQKLLDAGDYEGATKALGEVTRQAPTDEQRQQSAAISSEIEQRRRARRELGAWMQLLAHDRSKKEGDVRTAQLQLARKPEIALPLLLEAVQKVDQPHLVANSLELLVQLRRPEQALNSALGVLGRPEQKQNWPDAIRAIERAKQKGAGPLLLKLVLESKDATQRAAALDALAGVPDPPVETVVALLPLLSSADADLTAALRAVLRAVQVHDQFDLDARRGYPADLTEEQQQLLNALPGRLKEIMAAAGEGSSEHEQEAARVAQTLAVVLRQIAPAPLENLKVLTVVAEEEDGPAAAVLDGIWNSVELNTMWRHPIGSRASIILDLGEVRTVTAVKIWNFNQQGGAYRGWKEAEVYVSETPTALRPVTTGIVLQAPGAADTPDYSTVIPVPAVRGRYVTLKARSLWNPNTYTGLSEVQVIGF